jgi:hypothetical protein
MFSRAKQVHHATVVVECQLLQPTESQINEAFSPFNLRARIHYHDQFLYILHNSNAHEQIWVSMFLFSLCLVYPFNIEEL